jgi:hypothetical protein
MDDTAFDHLTLALSDRSSRRGLVAQLGAVAVALGLFLGAADADANHKKHHHKHKKHKRHSCKKGQKRCGGRCRNLQTDNTNCGGCGVVCPIGLPCLGGACAC